MDLLPRELHWRHFVNADNIAAGLSPLDPDAAAIPAGKLMLRRIHELAERGEDFAFESTLAAKSFAPFLRDLRDRRGYIVKIIYVWLESPEMAVERVAIRVQNGGHAIPEDVVRRRYRAGLTNFFGIYQPLADAWTVCDNSEADRTVVAEGGLATSLRIHDMERWSRILEVAS